jgi:glutathione peroxidase
MRYLTVLMLLLTAFQLHARECSPILDYNVRTLNGKALVNLCDTYQGKVILVVNTASRCAYTDQYDSLEKLYRQYREQGLVVLGFPSNDFGAQEPGTEKQIQSFCRLTYAVDFPMFAKTRVSERNADPLYQRLASSSGTYPKWNFHKYLLDRNGELVGSYLSAIDPMDDRIVKDINRHLKKF